MKSVSRHIVLCVLLVAGDFVSLARRRQGPGAGHLALLGPLLLKLPPLADAVRVRVGNVVDEDIGSNNEEGTTGVLHRASLVPHRPGEALAELKAGIAYVDPEELRRLHAELKDTAEQGLSEFASAVHALAGLVAEESQQERMSRRPGDVAIGTINLMLSRDMVAHAKEAKFKLHAVARDYETLMEDARWLAKLTMSKKEEVEKAAVGTYRQLFDQLGGNAELITEDNLQDGPPTVQLPLDLLLLREEVLRRLEVSIPARLDVARFAKMCEEVKDGVVRNKLRWLANIAANLAEGPTSTTLGDILKVFVRLASKGPANANKDSLHDAYDDLLGVFSQHSEEDRHELKKDIIADERKIWGYCRDNGLGPDLHPRAKLHRGNGDIPADGRAASVSRTGHGHVTSLLPGIPGVSPQSAKGSRGKSARPSYRRPAPRGIAGRSRDGAMDQKHTDDMTGLERRPHPQLAPVTDKVSIDDMLEALTLRPSSEHKGMHVGSPPGGSDALVSRTSRPGMLRPIANVPPPPGPSDNTDRRDLLNRIGHPAASSPASGIPVAAFVPKAPSTGKQRDDRAPKQAHRTHRKFVNSTAASA